MLEVDNKLGIYLLGVISGEKRGPLAFILRILFSLLEWLYYLIISLRYFLYRIGIVKVQNLPCQVISIGNITTGGTGKTPLVRFLATACKERSLRALIISRGYKSKGKEAKIIFDGKELLVTPEEAGDEALMLSQVLPGIPIITGVDRYSAGRLALAEFQPDLILLDDAFQHWQLARSKDLVLIDATNPFGFGHLLPRGLLREPLKALKRADLFLITRVNAVEEEKLAEIVGVLTRYNESAPVFMARYENKALRLYEEKGQSRKLEADYLQGKKVLAFSGIGNPASFQQSLEGCGAEVIHHFIYPDHYQYTGRDIEEMVNWTPRDSNLRGATGNVVKGEGPEKLPLKDGDLLITTEKDLARLNREMLSRLNERYRLAVLEIEVNIDGEEEFLNHLLQVKGKAAQERSN